MTGERPTPKGTDLEYQYADEALGQDTLPPPSKQATNVLKDKIFTRFPKKKLGIIVFLVIAIFIVYKFFSNSTPSTPSATTVLSQELTKPAQPQEAAPATPTPPATVTSSRALANLPASSTVSDADIQNLQAGVGQINQGMTQMQSALMTITNSLIQLSNRVAAVEKAQQKQAKRPPLTLYYLHSLVPERAWLHTSRGQLTTVKVGDILPGYGEIEKIDDNAGVVLTSSGREIHYGPYDG